jgi:hypothetical protein
MTEHTPSPSRAPSRRRLEADTFGSFELTRDALVERLGGVTFVYGRWDRLFACWHDAQERWTEFAPRWPLLDYFGEPLASEDDELGAVLGSYARLVPIEIRRLAGPFASWQWVVLAAVSDEPELVKELATELRAVGPGFVAGCLALARADELDGRARYHLLDRVLHEKRRELVNELVGQSGASLPVSCLVKLDPESATRVSCDRLLRLARDPRRARAVSHLRAITATTLRVAEELPAATCSPRVIELLSECTTEDAGEVLEALSLVASSRRDRLDDLAQALGRASDASCLIALAENWRERLMPFPAPPIAGTEALRPLSSAAAMRREALDMRNCLARLVAPVLEGVVYFYHWGGDEPATVGLRRRGTARWRLDRCLGAANAELSATTRKAVRRTLDLDPTP